jgi:hypothetical protein
MSESLSLKWGTLKAWELKTEPSMAALRKYHEAGSVSMPAMAQHDNDAQKDAVCELIDAVDCETIYLDWDAVYVTKEAAKAYVRNYAR